MRWRDLDLDAATMAVTNARVSTKDGGVIDSPPKSGHGRAVALDSATVAALRAHRKHQATEQLAYGPAYEKSGYVFTWEDGRPIRPDYVWNSRSRCPDNCRWPWARSSLPLDRSSAAPDRFAP